MSPDTNELVQMFEGAAAWADASGAIQDFNPAFAGWAPGYRLGRVERRAGTYWLLAVGKPPIRIRAEPLEGGHLVLPTVEGGEQAHDAVIGAVVRRADRIRETLHTNLQDVLLEEPTDVVRSLVQECLAVVDELRLLRSYVGGLASSAGPSSRTPLNLGRVAEEAVHALTGPIPVAFGAIARDCVVLASRDRVVWAIAALVGAMSRATAAHESVTVEVVATPDVGRIVLRSPSGLPSSASELAAARQAVEAGGGSVVLNERGVLLEFSTLSVLGATDLHRGRVLVVDDDEAMLALMGDVLRRDGWDVVEASNGVAASYHLRQIGHSLAAFVTDAALPGRSGLQLIAEAQHSLPNLPVLLVSGHDERALAVGDVPVLQKPFTPTELKSRLAEVVAGGARGTGR